MSKTECKHVIYELIKAEPGLSAYELEIRTGYHNRTIRLAARKLIDEGKVVKRRNILGDARTRVYYPVSVVTVRQHGQGSRLSDLGSNPSGDIGEI